MPNATQRRRLLLFVYLVVVCCSAARGELLAVAWDDKSTPERSDSIAYAVSSENGTSEILGRLGHTAVNSLTSGWSGDVFSIASPSPAPESGPFNENGSLLVKIDPSNGASNLAVQLDSILDIRAISYAHGNLLYAVVDGGQDVVTFEFYSDVLYTIDISTGTTLEIGDIGFAGIQAMEFSNDGRLYAWDSRIHLSYYGHGLIEIDPETAEAVDVTPGRPRQEIIQSIAFAPDGKLYGATLDALWEISPSDRLTQVGSEGFRDVRGIAFLVPEPSTAWLMIFGMLGRPRRRR